MIKQGAIGFWTIAAIQGVIGYFYDPSLLWDSGYYAVMATILLVWKSRVAAILLALIAVPEVVVTVLNMLGVTHLGGTNIILAGIVAIVSLRVIEATFKLRGRFCEDVKIA
jgi:hypothetical protein